MPYRVGISDRGRCLASAGPEVAERLNALRYRDPL